MTYISANCFCKSQFYIFYFCFVCGWFKLYMCIHKNKKQQHKILLKRVIMWLLKGTQTMTAELCP